MLRVVVWFGSFISCCIHYVVWREWRALCSRAYERQHVPFWSVWVKVFGRKHCHASWLRWTQSTQDGSLV